jgi:transcriptional regulator with XRE-family HTH domain
MADNHLGRKIQNLRKKANMTQQDLASKLSTAGSTISNWETGRRLPSIVDLTRMAELFNVSLSTFELQSSMLTDLTNLRTDILNTQQITYRSHMTKLSLNLQLALYLSIGCLYISLFVGDIFDMLFLLFGFMGIMYFVLSYVARFIIHRQTQYATRLVPLSSKVFYHNSLSKDDCQNLKTRLTVVSIFGMFLSLLFYITTLYALSLLNEPVISLFATMIAFISLFTQFLRHRSLSNQNLYVSNIDFFKTNKHFMRYAIISVLFLDLIVYLSMIAMTIIIGYALLTTLLIHLAGLLGLLMIVFSFDLFIQYYKYTSNFTIHIEDDENDSITQIQSQG